MILVVSVLLVMMIIMMMDRTDDGVTIHLPWHLCT